jgi:hypothetical protein
VRELPGFTPRESAMAQQADSLIKALPEIEGIARNVKNTSVIWVANTGERRLLHIDEQMAKMLRGAARGFWNEFAMPYETDPITGATEKVFNENGKETIEAIIFQRRS